MFSPLSRIMFGHSLTTTRVKFGWASDSTIFMREVPHAKLQTASRIRACVVHPSCSWERCEGADEIRLEVPSFSKSGTVRSSESGRLPPRPVCWGWCIAQRRAALQPTFRTLLAIAEQSAGHSQSWLPINSAISVHQNQRVDVDIVQVDNDGGQPQWLRVNPGS